ncbi:hypothetical protein NX02_08695 [Sphingomonas sanxanigenens DSM 19645 = NX02]|uniref:Uncharacterized protein n=1 Tax=Sphingomonas sanxanigenens DSM 19645 = NX02 TaxID=1123269 RepID=W0AAF0_9SPHN|nr:hypothetical protein NX02_08695 [Sphingomonas sanxanigenens DSM 19645 = NX02]
MTTLISGTARQLTLAFDAASNTTAARGDLDERRRFEE